MMPTAATINTLTAIPVPTVHLMIRLSARAISAFTCSNLGLSGVMFKRLFNISLYIRERAHQNVLLVIEINSRSQLIKPVQRLVGRFESFPHYGVRVNE